MFQRTKDLQNFSNISTISQKNYHKSFGRTNYPQFSNVVPRWPSFSTQKVTFRNVQNIESLMKKQTFTTAKQVVTATTNPIVQKKRELEEKNPKEKKASERQPQWKQRTRVRDLLFPVGRLALEGPLAEEQMKVNAYCTAESYDFEKLYPYLARVSPKVARTTSSHEVIYRPYGEHGHVFYFEGGSVVVWGASKQENENILNELKPFEVNPESEPQTETMNWTLTENQTGLSKDTIMISKQLEERDDTAHKLAFSYGMHQSVKLETYERKAENLFQTMKNTPELLVERKWSLIGWQRRQAVKMKHAELLKIRADINLYSELLEIPDVFWDEHYLEQDYRQIAKHLVIESRTATVNKKIDYSDQLNQALRTQLAEDYSIRLEWLIIILITIEVIQGLWLIAKDFYPEEEEAEEEK